MLYIFGSSKASYSSRNGLDVVKSTNIVGWTDMVTKTKRNTQTRVCHCGRSMPKSVEFTGHYDRRNNDADGSKSNLYRHKNGFYYIWIKGFNVKHGWEGLSLGCSKRCTLLRLRKPVHCGGGNLEPIYKYSFNQKQSYSMVIPWGNPDEGNF